MAAIQSELFDKARKCLRAFKADRYIFGLNCFGQLGGRAARLGKKAAVVTSGVGKDWGKPLHEAVKKSLVQAGVALVGELIEGAKPNSPLEDVFRIARQIADRKPDLIVAVGGGSVIDAAKAAEAFRTLGDLHPNLTDYFGMGQVTQMLGKSGRKLLPMLAVQLAASSAAHLTKYANVTDMSTSQKMLIIDEAVVPPQALFDYAGTTTMSRDFTLDGAFDGLSHCLEVYMGIPSSARQAVEEAATAGIELIINNVSAACKKPDDLSAREALGLGTDLGGQSIMIGGTGGAHLASFSLVDILSHGRACALMNPYYVVFFAPAIPDRLRRVGEIYSRAGLAKADWRKLSGRDLGLALAQAMVDYSKALGFPTTLREVAGFTDAHVSRALTAAKNPKLESKLKNMPVPLTAATIDDYMAPVLEAAKTGDFKLIRNLK
ncbi:MAG: iron-containing alcohol dehydrogenase [Planctomycetes bacterium]|nr:iron-containing alcohol dehydrogenase [Planctomycetota bacterium]